MAGITVILATHDNMLVDILQRRVVVLKNGQIISDRKKSGYYDYIENYDQIEILEIKNNF
jgi:ABC-type sulfate/molybdate transport systems ATPase subunit